MSKKELDELTYEIIGAAIEVHKHIGPGLLESVYHHCLKQELKDRNMKFVSEISVPVVYKGLEINTPLRSDFLVENQVVVEIKSVEAFHPIFDAQILSYMKLLQAPKGLLINFNCPNIFRDGQKTFVNELYKNLPVT